MRWPAISPTQARMCNTFRTRVARNFHGSEGTRGGLVPALAGVAAGFGAHGHRRARSSIEAPRAWRRRTARPQFLTHKRQRRARGVSNYGTELFISRHAADASAATSGAARAER
jgi:hypothetical protein